jgi:histone H3
MFSRAISKQLKLHDSTNPMGITLLAKQQLNSALCLISDEICKRIFILLSNVQRKTVTEETITRVLFFFLRPNTVQTIEEKGKMVLTTYSNTPQKGLSRQRRASILFPPAVTEKFIKKYSLLQTELTPIYFAFVIESITDMLLTKAIQTALERNHKRLTVRDLFLTLKKEEELGQLFSVCRVSFLGAGVVPFIHPLLLRKRRGKRSYVNATTIVSEENDDDTKPARRFRPGTVALREIRRLQKTSNSLILPKTVFEKQIRTIISNTKIAQNAIPYLQYVLEQYLIDYLQGVNKLAVHANRTKLHISDFTLFTDLKIQIS